MGNVLKFSLSIEDSLAEELCKFKSNEPCDHNLIEKILHYYKPYPLLSKELLKKYYGHDPSLLKSIIAHYHNKLTDNIEKDTKKYTTYKIILSRDKDTFPYVNVVRKSNNKKQGFSGHITHDLSATFYKNQTRDIAIEHLKSLFENAKEIIIYDQYLFANKKHQKTFQDFMEKIIPKEPINIHLYTPENDKLINKQKAALQKIYNQWKHVQYLFADKKHQKTFQDFMKEIIPKESINIHLFTPKGNEPDNEQKAALQNICNQWKIDYTDKKTNQFHGLHDRYIVIDNQLMIIFTSGIYHLMNNQKDFTYIIKEL